jgi:hypothetical protein
MIIIFKDSENDDIICAEVKAAWEHDGQLRIECANTEGFYRAYIGAEKATEAVKTLFADGKLDMRDTEFDYCPYSME